MARGQVFTQANQTGQIIESTSGEEMNSVAILNPNDGVVYVKLNGPAGSTPSQWDWKLPSQSYGLFPGPWVSLGVYYLDQSGSGRSAELNVYDSMDKLYTPYIVAIGRAVQSAGTTVDISQGVIPANPPAGSSRLWIDASNNLHVLNSTGVDQSEIDTNDALGGHLTGTLPSPSIANNVIGLNSPIIQNGAINAGKIQANTITAGQLANGAVGNPQLAVGAAAANLQVAQNIAVGDVYPTRPSGVDGFIIFPGSGWIGQASNVWQFNPGLPGQSIVNGTIPLAALAANSVDSSKIVDASVQWQDMIAPSGANSLTNASIVQAAPAGSTTSGTAVACPAPYNSISFDVRRSGAIFIDALLFVTWSQSNVTSYVYFAIDGGGQTNIGPSSVLGGMLNMGIPVSVHIAAGQLTIGTHTLNFYWSVSAGTMSWNTGIYSWCRVREIRA